MKVKISIWSSQIKVKLPSDKPIVFWDTCALVDIIRIPQMDREKLNIQTLENYEDIAQWIREGKVISVTSELVRTEFDKHFANELKKVDDQTKRYQAEVKTLSAYMQNTHKQNRVISAIDLLECCKRCEETANSICKNTIAIRQENIFMMAADYRVRNYEKPSGGKESYKDCYLWATFLKLVSELPITKEAFFFTSNYKDFGKGGKAKFNEDLNNECPAMAYGCLDINELHGKLLGIV